VIGDQLDLFFVINEFAIAVEFTIDDRVATLNVLFDREGDIIDGVILEAARLIGEPSDVEQGWSCEIEGVRYQVMSKTPILDGMFEYVLEYVTDRDLRLIQ